MGIMSLDGRIRDLENQAAHTFEKLNKNEEWITTLRTRWHEMSNHLSTIPGLLISINELTAEIKEFQSSFSKLKEENAYFKGKLIGVVAVISIGLPFVKDIIIKVFFR